MKLGKAGARFLCATTGMASLLLALAVRAETDRLPDIVLIVCDDLGYGDLGCYGGRVIETPNIDRLAAEGMRFTDFYSAYCLCSASRAALLTGCYPPRISMPGVIGARARVGLHPDETTIAEVLRSRGYRTSCIGKWHVGDAAAVLPTAQGFDRYFGIPYSNDMLRRKPWGNEVQDLDRIWQNKRWDIYANELYRDTTVVESPVDQRTITRRYTEEAVRFVREEGDEPFFLYLAHSMPHVPLFVPDELWDPDPRRAYELTVEHIDEMTGVLLDALEESGRDRETLLIFTSDNGPWLSKHHHGGSSGGLRAGKGTTYEGGMRVPCLMRWPGRIEAGRVYREVVATIDLLPTLAAIAGAELPPRPIDGVDVGPVLTDPSASSPREERGLLYYKMGRPVSARLGKWKLRRQRVDLKVRSELYDLEADPGETDNLTGRHPRIVDLLEEFLETEHRKVKAGQRDAWRKRG